MKNLLVAILLLTAFSCSKPEAPKPYGALPTKHQLAWHEMEFYAFIHFNMNTFTNMEWGMGDEDPQNFNPTELDCRQWARVIKDAGLKGIILTAKHHDGFCLWPSEYTEHSVKNSPWKDGKGDIVREFSDACKEYGLKFAVYLSPWDRNHAEYGRPEYVEYFRNQLKELLTNYGEVFEVWFDGANGGTGYYGGANERRSVDKKTYYDWENTYKIVYDLQPQAIIFSDGGPGCRWVGNESGYAYKTNWNTLNKEEFAPGIAKREALNYGQEDGNSWIPAEVDVSIRPGWYYHTYEDHKVKTLPQLLDIYYHSVGRGANLLLNFPVDKRGLIHEKDAEQIQKLADQLKKDFAKNLALNVHVTASAWRGSGYEAANMVDGDKESYWATEDEVESASFTLEFDQPTAFNRLLIQEYIALGQRIKEFSVEAFIENNWQTIANETTIGYKRILRLPELTATKIRVNLSNCKACPLISNVEVYNAPVVLTEPEVVRNKEGIVKISSPDSNAKLFYTLNGENPTSKSTEYKGEFSLTEKAVLKAVAVDLNSDEQSPVAMVDFDIPTTKWKVISPKADKKSNLIFDGDENTYWGFETKIPTEIVVDLGDEYEIESVFFTPFQGRHQFGTIDKYELYVGKTKNNWGAKVASGEFSNIRNSPVKQEIKFKAKKGRYIKLRGVSTLDDKQEVWISEISIKTK